MNSISHKYNIHSEAGPKGPASFKSKPAWRKELHAQILAGSLAVIAALIGTALQAQTDEKANKTVVLSKTNAQNVAGHHPREMTYIKRTWGIEIMFVRESSAGYMLEFRYKVLDAEKAAPLFVRGTKPVLIDAETGAELIVPTPPTTGALRNSNPPIEGRVYWMFFANPGRMIKPGQHVSIKIGDFRVDDLVVE